MRLRIIVLIHLWLLIIFLPPVVPCSSTECAVANKRVVCDRTEKVHNLFCSQMMSEHCDASDVDWPGKCHDTLGQVENKNVCHIERIVDKRCGTKREIKPRHITPPEKSLVELRLYHHTISDPIYGQQALVNLTLPAPTWKELQFQYVFIGVDDLNYTCRNFTLLQAVRSTLMYECIVLKIFENKTTNTRLNVQSDSGHGASYLFKIPPGCRINPKETCPSDWHTFFYIHQDALLLYNRLPVTIQSSPYGQVDYKIMLVRHLDTHNGENSTSYVVEERNVTINTSNDLRLVYLSPVTSPGNYTVRVQIVSNWCPKEEGCYVSVSPLFIIPPSYRWIFLLMTLIVFILSLICLIIGGFQRWIIYRDFFKQLKPPTVLLVYHPESYTALEFVSTLAKFLRMTCCVKDLMADYNVGNKNPITWTKTQISKANRILFIIPMDCEAESCTPLRNMWRVALNHCTGYESTSGPDHFMRLAKLMLPDSGDVPCEIRNLRRFDLTCHPAALANWLHGGMFLDQLFIWLPFIHSSRNFKPNWADVRSAARMITPAPTKLCDADAPQSLDKIVAINDGDAVQEDLKHSDDDDDDDDGACSGLVIDPGIPNLKKLCEPFQGSNESQDDSESGDDVFQ